MKKTIQYLALLKFFLICAASSAFGETSIGINGAVEWDKMEITASVSLDLASAHIRLPAGRLQGEELINAEYLRLVRPEILNLRVDSSSTVGDLVNRGEWSLFEAERFALRAKTVPPALSPDLRNINSFYTLDIAGISSALIRHTHPAEIMRTLSPAAAPAYTGIVIIASENLPVHGRKGSALLVPCIFPKIWDADMNLIFEKNMLTAVNAPLSRYAPSRTIFNSSPSGISPEIASIVGDRPLRIFARGVFGINPTDPIIDREDALSIISSEENRRLLQQGRLVIIVDEKVLKDPLSP